MKRKLLALVFALLFSATAFAGHIESPGYTDIPYAASSGYEWTWIDGLWYLMSLT